jgi:hypothetical protein
MLSCSLIPGETRLTSQENEPGFDQPLRIRLGTMPTIPSYFSTNGRRRDKILDTARQTSIQLKDLILNVSATSSSAYTIEIGIAGGLKGK